MKIKDHKAEIYGGFVFVILSFSLPFSGVSNDIAFLSAIISAIAAFSVAVVKDNTNSEVRKSFESIENIYKIQGIMSGIDGKQYSYAKEIIKETTLKLKKIQKGEIELEPSLYFKEIIDRMNNSKSKELIYSVNSIDELRWEEDPRQRNYWAANKRAATREVIINRIFIIDKKRFFNDKSKNRLKIVKEQNKIKNINVEIVWKYNNYRKEKRKLNMDWVLFSVPKKELFIGFQDEEDETRILGGLIVTDENKIDEYLKQYYLLLNEKISDKEKESVLFLGDK